MSYSFSAFFTLFCLVIPVCHSAFSFQRPVGCESDVALGTGLIKESLVRSRTECAYECTKHSNCIGFNFEEDKTNTTRSCELLSVGSDMYASHITSRLGFAYYERTEESTSTCSRVDSSIHCPEGWTRHMDSCYLFYTAEDMDFANAKAKCSEYGAHLVAITTEAKQTFLVDYITKQFDIDSITLGFATGANDINVERKWEWDYYGTLVENEYNNWSGNEGIGHISTSEHCMKIAKHDDWKWHDYSCASDRSSPFICEKTIQPNPTMFEVLDQKRVTYDLYDFLAVKVRIPENETCPSGDCCLEYQNLCQYLGPFKPTGCSRPHITEAMTDYQRCESTYNADINIEDKLGCNPSAKIKTIANAAFGGGAVDGNSFGTTICSTAKCTDKLSTTTSNQGLNRLDSALSSADRIAYTVCREDYGQSCVCPDGYYMYRCSCYKFVNQLVTFSTARSNCQADCPGCDLVAIEDVTENTYVRNTILNTPTFSSSNRFWWIDAYAPEANSVFFYKTKASNTQLTYVDWQSGQPNDVNARCIALWPSYSYHWADESCGRTSSYVCEVDMRLRGCTCPKY